MIEPDTPIQAVERVAPGAVDTSGLPLPAHLPKDYRERFDALTRRVDFADTIFANLANGGTLITLAEAWGVRHSDIAGYVSTSQLLKDRYAFALLARDEWEKERCLQELRAIATVDIRQAYNEDGTLKSIRELPAQLAAALSSVESDELFKGQGAERELIGYTRKVKFWDKAKAIELFMKKHGLLIDRVKVQQVSTLEDIVGASQADVVDAEIIQPATVVSEIPKSEGVPGVLGIQNP